MLRSLFTLILVGLVVGVAYRTSLPGESGSADGRRGRRGSGNIAVRVATATTGVAQDVLETVGLVEALGRIPLVPLTSGQVDSVHFEPGDRVSKGDVLVVLDAREPELKVRQAEADLALAEGSLNQATIQAELAEAGAQRQRELRRKGLASEQKIEEVEAQLKRSRAQILVDQARRDQARAALAERRLILGHTRLIAPVDAVVDSRDTEVGAFVTSQSVVGRLILMDPVRIYIWADERTIGRIRGGQRARVRPPGRGREGLDARVIRTSPSAHVETRLFRVEVQVPNPSHDLRPGMFTRVETVLEERPGAVLIPLSALVQEVHREVGSGIESVSRTGVFVVTGDTVSWRDIEIGIRMPEVVEVVDGLESGETVVTLGKHLLADGASIRIAEGSSRLRADGEEK